MTAFHAALAPARSLPGSNPAGFRRRPGARPGAPGSRFSAVTESARPKVFSGPCRFSVYMLLTAPEKIYMLFGQSARENTMSAIQVVAAPALQPQQLFLQVGRKRYQVASIAEAVEMHNAAR